jgi:flagellar biosynthesis GTPase FlhF
MAMQVVTPQNFQQLIETGSVPAFKAPEAPAEPKPANGESAPAKPSDAAAGEPARDANGRFTAKPAGDTTTTADKPAVAPAGKTEGDDDEGGADLPEHARKVIGKKHRQMKEAEEFASKAYRERLAAEERAEKLQRQLEQQNAKSRPAPAEAPKEPKPADFATVAEYTDALVEYRVAEKFKAEREKQEREAAEQAAAERVRKFQERVAKANEKYPDFDEVVNSLSRSEHDLVPIAVIEFMQESEFGTDILYGFAKDPKTLDRFRKLSPARLNAELGKLEAKYETAAVPPKQETASLSQVAAAAIASQPVGSKAPAPIEPLSGDKSTSAVRKDPATMSFRELREYERQRDAERRSRS